MSIEPESASRLPRDPAYWDQLAARSIEAALQDERARDAGPHIQPWWQTLSDASLPLAASAVLALIGAALLLGPRAPAGTVAAGAAAHATPSAASSSPGDAPPSAANSSPRAAAHAPPPAAMSGSNAIAAALAPEDALLTTLLQSGSEPPPASALLGLIALREGER